MSGVICPRFSKIQGQENQLLNLAARKGRTRGTALKIYRSQVAVKFAQYDKVDVHIKDRVVAQVDGKYIAKLCIACSPNAMGLIKTLCFNIRRFGDKWTPRIAHKQLMWLERARYMDHQS